MRVRFSDIRKLFLPHTADQIQPISHINHTPDAWLVQFYTILMRAGVRLTPLYGTCLGLFRDNQLIPGDTDADFGIALSDVLMKELYFIFLGVAAFFFFADAVRVVFDAVEVAKNQKFQAEAWSEPPEACSSSSAIRGNMPHTSGGLAPADAARLASVSAPGGPNIVCVLPEPVWP